MKKEKFLTVFAVFDDETQNKLKHMQNQIFDLGYPGTQTMGIPFHITLGSFPPGCEEELIQQIKDVCSKNVQFDITLNKLNNFGNAVLFAEPEINEPLLHLHNLFNNNYADGLPWHPHATLFCGPNDQVMEAENMLSTNFKPIHTKIVGIQMGEFFPTKMIIEEELIK